MKILCKTNNLTHDQWLEKRRLGIGSSDAPTVVGLNPYGSLYSLYADKKGFAPELEETEPMRQGTDLEDYVAKRFMEATGKRVKRNNAILQREEHPFMLANLDRVVIGESVPLECKTTSVRNKHDFEDGDIPPYYYVQVQHQLAVTGALYAYLAVLVLSSKFYWFKIDRHEEDIQALISAEKRFWEEYIVKDIVPEPGGTERDTAIIKGLNLEDNGAHEISLTHAEHLVERLEEIDGLIAPYIKEKEEVRQKLMLAMGTAHRGDLSAGSVSYKPFVRASVDSKLLKERYPNIYRTCLKETTVRSLRINGR